MDPKKEIKELRGTYAEMATRINKLEDALREELPFQEKLDEFCRKSGFRIVEAHCDGVIVEGRHSHAKIAISSAGNTTFRDRVTLGTTVLHLLITIAEALTDCHDC